jgi:outer membrane lipoprotein-sorting protein
MPTLDEVLAKYVEASGGAAAINAVSSRVTKGILDVIGVSRGGTFEVQAQAPNKTLTVLDAYPLGIVKLGFNGKTGWAQTKAGMRLLNGVELGTVQRDSEFYAQVRLKSIYTKVSLLGKSKIGYREVYVVEFQPSSGPNEKMFLDAETYLPVRVNTFRPLGAQMVAVEVYYDDWRDVDGIKLPFRISQNMGRQTLVFTVKEIKHNVVLNASIFDPPAK